MSAAVKTKSNFDFVNQIWSKYLPYWPIFLIILALSLGVAWYKIKTTNPLYLSSTSIMIKEKKKGADEEKVIESLNPLLSPEKLVENEMVILRSKSLMTEVVKNENLYAPVYETDRFKKSSAYKTSPVLVVAKNADSIYWSSEIPFTVNLQKGEVSFNNKTYAINSWIDTKFGTIKFVPNKIYEGNKYGKLSFEVIPPKSYASSFSSNLNIQPVNKSNAIIEIAIMDEVPERGEAILNELIQVYNQAAQNDKNIAAQGTLEFLETRLAGLSKELDSIEKKISGYKSSAGAVDITAEGQNFLENISRTDRELGEVNLQLSVLNQIESYVKTKNDAGGIVPSTMGLENSTLDRLLDKLYDAELQKEELKKTVPENNPTVVAITDQINKIKPSILENIKNERQALIANKNTLQSTSGLYSSMLQGIPQKERQLIDISRDHAIKSNIYTFLLKKREETALSYATQATDSRVIDEATSQGSPLVPNAKKIYMIAILASLIISVGLISAKELLNRNVLFRHEIEAATTLPIISEIALDKSGQPLVPADGKNTILASQFRKLRNALGFLGIDASRKKILVTSTISGEGKSFITANLGLTLANANKKVVLLEFDLINPALSEKFGIHGTKGLSDFINGDVEPEEIITRSKINENLFIISSGQISANSSELILNEKVESLFTYLEGIFDYIIVDTAPVGPMSDAYVLSTFCDATLYIIRHKYTPKKFLQRIDEEMKILPLKNAAIVFNGLQSRGFSKNSYGMGYGYGYEYIYKGDKKSKYKYIA